MHFKVKSKDFRYQSLFWEIRDLNDNPICRKKNIDNRGSSAYEQRKIYEEVCCLSPNQKYILHCGTNSKFGVGWNYGAYVEINGQYYCANVVSQSEKFKFECNV